VVPGAVTIDVVRDTLEESDQRCAVDEDDSVLVSLRIKSRYVFFAFFEIEGISGESIPNALAVSDWSDDIV
jgi:hypothetical protein